MELKFKDRTCDRIYSDITGRDNDIDYLQQAKIGLYGRGKWSGLALIDLINAKLEIYELKKRINELEGADVYNLDLLSR